MRFETNIRYDFIKNRGKFFYTSLALTLIGILSLIFFQLNLGVDFKAGTNMDVSTEVAVTKADVDSILNDTGFSHAQATVGGDNNRITIRFDNVLEQSETKKVEDALTAKFGEVSTEVHVVSPEMAQELGIKTIWAILIASVGIMLYVMIRFEWRFALAANISILYDSFFVIAMFSIFRLEVDLPFIAAVLTTLGYSINDKIVIFDRVRENMRFSSVKNESQLAELVNASIWQTMARNLYTVLTVVLITLCIFFWGSPSIKLFSLALLIGLVSGAYSTVAIAGPLWFVFKRKQKVKPKAAKTTAP